MTMLNTLKATLIATTVIAIFAVEAQAATAPSYVRVRSLSYAGSGCSAGSVDTSIAADRQSFTMYFDEFLAEVGPGVALREKRKNCQLNIDLDYPSGWSYAVASLDYRGYVSLERGITATQSTSLYFQGQGQRQTATLRQAFTGPIERDFLIHDGLAGAARVWSPCGSQRSLNLNTSIQLNTSSSERSGLITLGYGAGDLPGGVGQLALVWKRCR